LKLTNNFYVLLETKEKLKKLLLLTNNIISVDEQIEDYTITPELENELNNLMSQIEHWH
jgi:hypothetical protein